MLTKRIIPCLDIKNGRTVKGVNFVDLKDAGDPVELAKKYAETGADELVFLDISATEERRATLIDLVRKVAAAINIPFTVGGGISAVSDVEVLLQNGADKVSINSSAVKNPQLINDLAQKFKFGWPSPFSRILLLRDALKAGILFPCDVPVSSGQKYPKRKKEILDHVPPGGYWRDLPEDLQKEYMQGSYFLQGGKTGMARRLSYDEPSLTLTCAPAQKQTERCHPEETRPLTVREYARIQTFPDDWHFCGSLSSQYKQIGNAVPVNLAFAMGRSLIRLFNDIEEDIVRESVSDESDPIKQMEFAF